MRLKIFSDRHYLPRGMKHAEIFYPFWGKNQEEDDDPETGKFDRYVDTGSAFFEITLLDEADLAILPFDWFFVGKNRSALNLAFQFASDAGKVHIPVVIFFFGDWCKTVPLDNVIIFRTSLYRSTRKSNEFAMPGWSEDFVTMYVGSKLPIRQKKTKPTVGFCGWTAPTMNMLGSLYECVLQAQASVASKKRPQISTLGHIVMPIRGRLARSKALSLLSKSPLLSTNFVIRNQYWAGALLGSSVQKRRKVRLEYVKNMLESDYILCTRGAGNYSYRLYETLCCGRIPVFIDTDCVLPYDFEIDWKKYCIWVDQGEIDRIGEKIAEFHKNLSSQEFVNLQHECRRIWENWLSPEGFFRNFYKHFAYSISQNTTDS